MRRLELRIALRYMQSRRGSRLLSLISLIAFGGLVVAVGALVIVIGVMNGLQSDLREKILTGSPDIRVLPWGDDLVMRNWRPIIAQVESVPGVLAVAPFVQGMALVNVPGQAYHDVVRVVGLSDTGVKAVTKIRSTAISGEFAFRTEGGLDGAVLGKSLAARLNVTPGVDSVVLLTGNKINPVTGLPDVSMKPFLVTGIFETGMFEYDDSYIYIALTSAQSLVKLDSAVTGLEVRTATRDAAFAVGERIGDTLGVSARTQDWKQANASLFSALKLEKFGMTIILMLIILVAAFNIVGTLTMVVHDKTREVGILRAMGMPATSIRWVFFTQGMVIGIAGTLVGLVVGLVTSYVVNRFRLIPLDPSIYFIDHLPVSSQPLDVMWIVVGSMMIAALATLLPSMQAARLFPVDAIRHE